jgi:DNA-binding HxlR family transcriptional regulator
MKFSGDVTECPVRKALSVLGGKWKLVLIYQIGEETIRYGELRKRLPDISERMFILELKSLLDDGVIARRSHGEVPPRVDYWLTERGKRVLPLIAQLEQFGLSIAKAASDAPAGNQELV